MFVRAARPKIKTRVSNYILIKREYVRMQSIVECAHKRADDRCPCDQISCSLCETDGNVSENVLWIESFAYQVWAESGKQCDYQLSIQIAFWADLSENPLVNQTFAHSLYINYIHCIFECYWD